jgi:hypothetical protein
MRLERHGSDGARFGDEAALSVANRCQGSFCARSGWRASGAEISHGEEKRGLAAAGRALAQTRGLHPLFDGHDSGRPAGAGWVGCTRAADAGDRSDGQGGTSCGGWAVGARRARTGADPRSECRPPARWRRASGRRSLPAADAARLGGRRCRTVPGVALPERGSSGRRHRGAARTRRIVYRSAQAASIRPDSFWAQVERVIECSVRDWTFLRPPGFARQPLCGRIRSGAACRALVYGQAARSLIDERDIAAVAVRALIEDGHSGKRYVLAGPETIPRLGTSARSGRRSTEGYGRRRSPPRMSRTGSPASPKRPWRPGRGLSTRRRSSPRRSARLQAAPHANSPNRRATTRGLPITAACGTARPPTPAR